jgi:histidinol dehydrogenase
MKHIKYPDAETWPLLCKRPTADNTAVHHVVKNIIDDIAERGDEAVVHYNTTLDGTSTTRLQVSQSEIDAAVAQVPIELKTAIQQAKQNIEAFHKSQLIEEAFVETVTGVLCKRINKPIQKVGLYVPSGTAPLFSTVLMLAIPATIAGCKNIVMCTPCKNNAPVNAAILYTAQLCGVKQIFKVGGAAAIAAMSIGTEQIPKVYKIFGPGNQYVTAAKEIVQGKGTAIDMPAGPSEVCILADESARPAFVAADLLSQAEHGTDSQVTLVCKTGFDINTLKAELLKQVENLPRKEICLAALDNSAIIEMRTINECIAFANEYAAEHLIISMKQAANLVSKIENAGSIFLGNYTPESVGDYASGTNHTLPTAGYAKQYSGVSVDSFIKKITVQELTKDGLQNIAKTVMTMAKAEALEAHSNAVAVRLTDIEK